MSVYTPAMQRAVKDLKVPHDFQVDIVEYDQHPPFIGIRFYESHWARFTDLEKIHCIRYMQNIKNIIESYGVNVTLDPVYDAPGVQQIR